MRLLFVMFCVISPIWMVFRIFGMEMPHMDLNTTFWFATIYVVVEAEKYFNLNASSFNLPHKKGGE